MCPMTSAVTLIQKVYGSGVSVSVIVFGKINNLDWQLFYMYNKFFLFHIFNRLKINNLTIN